MFTHTRGWLRVLSVAVVLLIAAFGSRLSTVSAATPGSYNGLASDLGSVVIQVAPDGLRLQSLALGAPAVAVSGQCLSAATNLTLTPPIVGESVNLNTTVTSGSTGVSTAVELLATFDASGRVSGTLTASPTASNPCVQRKVTWVATAKPSSFAPVGGSRLEGTTDTGAPVVFVIDSDSKSISGVSIAVPSGCATISSAGPFSISAEGIASIRRPAAIDPILGRVVFAISGTEAVGVYAISDPSSSACPKALGTFTANSVTPQASSPPPAASIPSAEGFAGAAPGRGSIGLLVTTRPSSPGQLADALAASGCPVESLAILSGGVWSVWVNGAPAIVNAGFPSSLAANTAFFVRCVN